MSELGHEPLSWLTLEQYVLGDLGEQRRREVEAQLERSAADREVLRSILEDQSELPPLHLPASGASPLRPSVQLDAERSVRRRRSRWLWASAPVLAAAAALLLLRLDAAQLPPARRALKGGELAVRVVSERGGDAVAFAEGERLKLLVTCPPELAGSLGVVVFQDGERFTPLPDGPGFACGNRTPWPGAFTLDGDAPAHVCVASAARARSAQRPEELGERSVCAPLAPRPPPHP